MKSTTMTATPAPAAKDPAYWGAIDAQARLAVDGFGYTALGAPINDRRDRSLLTRRQQLRRQRQEWARRGRR